MSAVPVRRRTSRGIGVSTACAIAMLFLVARGASAQLPLQPASPFDITGYIQAATLDTPGDVLSGGSITVNNHVIKVPRNTILQMPAFALTWQQLWAFAPAPYAGTIYTGLAMSDLPAPYANYEAHVQGNRVGNTYLAGLIFISQHSLMVGEGFINYIDYVNGEMRVGGLMNNPLSGARVQLNDPMGRFGRAMSPDVRFTIDENNPTVKTGTGYPVCLPRYDPHVQDDGLCPAANRSSFMDAAGNYLTIFTMPPHTAGQLPDPYLMAPMEVGDYIDFNGILLNDAKGDYVSAWGITDNLGAYTTPGTQPAYVAIDVMVVGVGVGNQPLPAEAAFRTVVEGFTTDTAGPVSLFGVDINPITGVPSDRQWIDLGLPVVVPIDPGPPTGAIMGRYRFRPGKAALTLPPTRELHATSATGQLLLPNGLLTGQYQAPIFAYIFPENLAIGGAPVPENLQDFHFLAQGSGPLNGTGPIVGQLAPWPGALNPPLAGAPPSVAPAVSAGPAQTVITGATVTLDGSGSFDPNGGLLGFTWTQTAGTGVLLLNASSPSPSFVALAPANGVSENLIFSLTVTNGAGLTASAPVTITVNAAAVPAVAPIANAGQTQTVNSGAFVTLNGLASSDPNTPPLGMFYSWVQSATGGLAPVVLTNATTATPTFSAPLNATPAIVPITFTLTVTNTAGLVSTAPPVTVNVNSVQPPVSVPGATFSALVNTTVTLDGSQSFDPNGLPLTYSWVQQGGGAVALTGANTAKPTFKAPLNATTLGFVLTVSNGFTFNSAVIQVFIVQKDQITVTAVVYRVAQSRLKITATSNVFGAQLTASWLNTVTGQIQSAPMPLLLGVPTADILGVPIPPNVTITSTFGGSQTSGVTRVQ